MLPILVLGLGVLGLEAQGLSCTSMLRPRLAARVAACQHIGHRRCMSSFSVQIHGQLDVPSPC